MPFGDMEGTALLWQGHRAPTATNSFPLPKEPPVPPLLLDPDKPMGITMSVLEAQKTADPSRLDQLRPPELPRAKESVTAPVEKPRLSDGHPGKKALSILSYVRGPLAKDIPVPLSHSVNGKSKPWEPFIAEEFAHQFHESVLQSTQKALQKHKGEGRDTGRGLGTIAGGWDTPSSPCWGLAPLRAQNPPAALLLELLRSSGVKIKLKVLGKCIGKYIGKYISVPPPNSFISISEENKVTPVAGRGGGNSQRMLQPLQSGLGWDGN